MRRILLLTILLLSFTTFCFSQKTTDTLAIDTTVIDYDALFSELDELLDSLTEPRSLTIFNVAIGQSFLSFDRQSGTSETRQRLTYSPSIGHYNKTGFGITFGSSFVHDGTQLNPYQYSITGSYDYQKKKQFITGVSFSHFFTKNNLPFYTSPLQNEIYGYFTYRKHWLRPSIGVSYGWGSREAFEEVEDKIQNINLRQRGFTRINTSEKVVDLNLIASVRHDFYFLRVLASDYVRLTPQLTFTSGSQQFGFNQTSNSYATMRRTGRNVLYNSENVTFDNQFYFQPISLTAFLKTEYAIGKLYVQPQVLFDYYIPSSTQKFSSLFLVNAGVWF